MEIQGYYDDCFCKKLSPGFRFMPSDEELCNLYLRAKIEGRSLPCSHVIAGEFEIYKEDNLATMPWDLIKFDDPLWFPSSDSSNGNMKTKKSLYFFTKLKMDGKHASRRVGSAATWKNQNKKDLKDKAGAVIGQKKLFSYDQDCQHDQDSKKRKKNIEDDHVHMIMHEYSLLDFPSYVLCKIIKEVIISKVTKKNFRVSLYSAPNYDQAVSSSNHLTVEPKSVDTEMQYYIGEGIHHEALGEVNYMVNNVDLMADNNIDHDHQHENSDNAADWGIEDFVELSRWMEEADDDTSYGRVIDQTPLTIVAQDQRVYTSGVDACAYEEAYRDNHVLSEINPERRSVQAQRSWNSSVDRTNQDVLPVASPVEITSSDSCDFWTLEDIIKPFLQ